MLQDKFSTNSETLYIRKEQKYTNDHKSFNRTGMNRCLIIHSLCSTFMPIYIFWEIILTFLWPKKKVTKTNSKCLTELHIRQDSQKDLKSKLLKPINNFSKQGENNLVVINWFCFSLSIDMIYTGRLSDSTEVSLYNPFLELSKALAE